MIRESALLNCVYPLNRKEQLEEEIGSYGCMSEVPKQYSSILLCVIHLIKQFLDGKTKEKKKQPAADPGVCGIYAADDTDVRGCASQDERTQPGSSAAEPF